MVNSHFFFYISIKLSIKDILKLGDNSMEIRKDVLENITNNYLQDLNNKTARCALARNKIRDIMRNKEKDGELLFNFSLNLDSFKPSNQQKSGSSFIYAGCNLLRASFCKKYDLNDFEFSQSYIAFYDKLEKFNYYMESLIALKDNDKDNRERYHILTKGIVDEGSFFGFRNIINKYGIVPKGNMNDTYQSLNTEEMNYLINRKLRQFNARILKNEQNLDYLKSIFLDDVFRILANCYGVPPKKFNFEYTDKDKKYHIIKDITPLEFYKEYMDFDFNNYVSIINVPTNDKPYNKLYSIKYLGNVIENGNYIYLNLPLDDFKSLIIKQLEARELVYIGCDYKKAVDVGDGIFDDLSFNYYDTFRSDFYMSKEDALDNYESSINHSMVITGVNLDNNIPTKWKIENSWGSNVGNNGYFVASSTWFDKYVYSTVINKKYLNEEQIEVLKEQVIELEPWDILGMFA